MSSLYLMRLYCLCVALVYRKPSVTAVSYVIQNAIQVNAGACLETQGARAHAH
jgi:hypothetical protein